jgi:hypothetical protein
MEKFFLITNVSGQKYWSKLVTECNCPSLGVYARAIKLTGGPIYVNRRGGWFPMNAAKTIHETVEAENFPVE